MTLIIDASVAVKWLLREDGSEAAKALIADEILAAPEFLFVECANVLRTKTRRGELTPELAREGLSVLDAIPLRAIASRPHVAAAYVIAQELDRSAYDSLYLAVAVAEHAVLVTADAKFASAVHAHPVYRASLRMFTSNG